MNVNVMLLAQTHALVLEVFSVTQLPCPPSSLTVGGQAPRNEATDRTEYSQLRSQQMQLMRHDLIASALAQQLGVTAYYPVPPSRVNDALRLHKHQTPLNQQSQAGPSVVPPQDSAMTDKEVMEGPCFCFQVDRSAIPQRVLKELNSMRLARCQGMLEWQTWRMEALAAYMKDMEREKELKCSNGGSSNSGGGNSSGNVQGKARGSGGSSRARGPAAGNTDFDDDDDDEEDDDEDGDSEHKAESKGQLRGRAPGYSSSPEDVWDDEEDMEEAMHFLFWDQIDGMDDTEAAEFCGLLPVLLGGRLVLGVRLA